MDLVQVILMIFGLSLKYKALDQILSGVLISMLSFVSLFFIIPYNSDHLVIKLSALCVALSSMCGYILLKRRTEKFCGMYGEISAFDVRFRRKRSNLAWSNFILFVCFG